MKSYNKTLRRVAVLLLPLAGALAGCTRDHEFQPVDMWNDSRLKPYEGFNGPNGGTTGTGGATPTFVNRYTRDNSPLLGHPGGTTAMPIPGGTIARGQLRANTALYEGRANGELVTEFPFPVTEAVLKRGQERYFVYCAPCHGGLGDGNGIIVQRGFAKPPDYTQRRLVDAPVGHYYDVITNGYGAMYAYADRVPVNDRWAITAYIRLLQQTRLKGKGNAGLVPGGGVYSPQLKSARSQQGHGADQGHGSGGAHETSPGVAPGSVAIEDKEPSHGAAEGPTHEKAEGSQEEDKSPAASDAQAGPGGKTQLP
jgi:hypothetical protein